MTSPLDIYDLQLKVFGAPSRYVQGRGILNRTASFARQVGKSAVLVADIHILPLIEETLRKSFQAAEIPLLILPFEGHLGLNTPTQLVSSLNNYVPEIVVAAGGGRAIDAGKALADTCDLRLITVPTVASNDAPTSKNYVLYDENEVLVEVRHLARNPDFVIVDTQLLASAPKAMFAAGLGDALSKKAEALACAAGCGGTMFRARPTNLAVSIASLCYDTLLSHGQAAFDAAGSGQPTDAFETAVEAMILMAGLGFESGGLSVPHALTRGLSKLPGVALRPHGYQVAYGLVIHHKLIGIEFPETLRELYRHTGLPTNLRMLAQGPVEPTCFDAIADATIGVPHMLNFPRPISVEDLVNAMRAVEDDEA